MTDQNFDGTKKIEYKDKTSLNEIAKAMKNKETFIISTDDKKFNPLGYDRYSADKWIGAAGGGTMMLIGAGALVLAFLDPEPTTKLGTLVIGGTIMTLAGGGVIITILITRAKYKSIMTFNKETGKYEWILEPRSRK